LGIKSKRSKTHLNKNYILSFSLPPNNHPNLSGRFFSRKTSFFCFPANPALWKKKRQASKKMCFLDEGKIWWLASAETGALIKDGNRLFQQGG